MITLTQPHKAAYNLAPAKDRNDLFILWEERLKPAGLTADESSRAFNDMLRAVCGRNVDGASLALSRREVRKVREFIEGR